MIGQTRLGLEGRGGWRGRKKDTNMQCLLCSSDVYGHHGPRVTHIAFIASSSRSIDR